MTVRIERVFDLPLDVDEVWSFIADPEQRAEAISVVESWDREDGTVVWHLVLPIPFVSRTIAVRTRDVERVDRERVVFEGRSSVMHVRGVHELDAGDTGTRLTNRFVVEGRVPGVERFFERNLDQELDNLERALRESATDVD